MAYNVLIVDDSAVVRSVIEKILRLSSAELGDVLHAGNGREALDKLKAHWVDIVFADINMPEMNGIEMVKHMSDTGMLRTIPVIIVSTVRCVTTIAQLQDQGVSACLNKPFTPEEIRGILEKVLMKRA